MQFFNRIQQMLEFEGCKNHPLFNHKKGLGRIAVTGFILGVVLGLHLTVILASFIFPVSRWLLRWSVYLVSLSFFHFSEFFTTALYKPEAATYDSFVVNHSVDYTIAAICSWGEFFLEQAFVPSIKTDGTSFLVGLCLVLMGQSCRIIAMHTAKSNFSHVIMEKKDPTHRLVTHGIYGVLRHPSYFGWFWMVVGTQILLANPICLVGYTCTSWLFFKSRIKYEEGTLVAFYPEEYPAYRGRTFVGIPGIR